MGPRQRLPSRPPRTVRTLLTLLFAYALCLLAAAPPAGATGRRRGSHHGAHRAQRACRAHAKHHHARGCKSNAHPHKGKRHRKAAHRHKAPLQILVQAPAQAEEVDAAVIAGILATPCQKTQLTPAAGNLQAVTAATLCLVNQERARHNEMPLQLNRDLEEAADGHSQEMVSQDYFAHVAPSGLTPLGRVQGTGYIPSPQDGYAIGENIAWGTSQLSTPQAIVAAWIASPEHLANILEAKYRDTAIGIDPQAPPSLSNQQDGAVYTQEFGVIIQ